jgi:hypothetical protein
MALKRSIDLKHGCNEREFEIKIPIRISLLWQSDIVFVSLVREAFNGSRKINEMEDQIVPIQEFA